MAKITIILCDIQDVSNVLCFLTSRDIMELLFTSKSYQSSIILYEVRLTYNGSMKYVVYNGKVEVGATKIAYNNRFTPLILQAIYLTPFTGGKRTRSIRRIITAFIKSFGR